MAKGGSRSRQLLKAFDGLSQPVAILDRAGEIIFINQRLADLLNASPDELVGKRCCWELPADDEPYGAVLAALAPPAIVREGQVAIRRLPQPLLAAPDSSAQFFLPLLDPDRVVELVLVIFGTWDYIDALLGTVSPPRGPTGQSVLHGALVELRRRWPRLDGLEALLGNSPAIRLAMKRTQAAANSPCNVWWWGPPGVGKRQVAEAVWHHRQRVLHATATASAFLPVDCRFADLDAMVTALETFQTRLRSDAPAGAQVLLLDAIEHLDGEVLVHLLNFIQQHAGQFTVFATSQTDPREMLKKSPLWEQLCSTVAEAEIHLPGLASRPEDIAPLCEHFIARECREQQRFVLRLDDDALNVLQVYAWPQNVHELRETMRYCVKQAVLTRTIEVRHLPVAIRTFPSAEATRGRDTVQPINLDEVLREVERTMVQRALKLSPRNRAQAARLLGISRPRLLRLIAQHNLHDQPTGDSPNDEQSQ